MAIKLSMKQNMCVFFLSSFIALIITLSLFMHYSSMSTGNIDRVIHVESEANFLLHEMWAQGLQTEQALRNIMLNPTDEKAANNFAEADRSFSAANAKVLNIVGK